MWSDLGSFEATQPELCRWVTALFLLLVLPACVSPEEAAPRRSGLGVKRAALQAALSRPDLGFTFREAPKHQGVPRVTGTVSGKLVALDLVGPPEELTQVTLMVGVPSTDPLAPPRLPKVLAENGLYLRAVLEKAMPDWKEGGAWLKKQLQRPGERQAVGVRKGAREVVLLAVNHGSMVLLSIRIGQPAPGRSR